MESSNSPSPLMVVNVPFIQLNLFKAKIYKDEQIINLWIFLNSGSWEFYQNPDYPIRFYRIKTGMCILIFTNSFYQYYGNNNLIITYSILNFKFFNFDFNNLSEWRTNDR